MNRLLKTLLPLGLSCCLLAFAVPAFAAAADMTEDENMSMSITEDQMAFGMDHWLGSDDFFGNLLKKSTPNVRARLKTKELPAAIKSLEVSADFCGVLVEPSQSGKLELFLAGVKEADRSKVKVDLSVGQNGALKLTAKGEKSLHFISMKENSLVNTVVLQVPPSRIPQLTLNAGCGMIRSFDLADKVSGKTDRGSLEIRDENVRGSCELHSESGDVKVCGTGAISGKISLSTQNGDALLKGGTVSGAVDIASSNGDSLLFADSVSAAALSTANGDVLMEIGSMKGNVSLTSGNGDVLARFKKAPQNLSLSLQAGNGDHILPAGWKNGYSCGTGSPKLTVESGNGDVLVMII